MLFLQCWTWKERRMRAIRVKIQIKVVEVWQNKSRQDHPVPDLWVFPCFQAAWSTDSSLSHIILTGFAFSHHKSWINEGIVTQWLTHFMFLSTSWVQDGISNPLTTLLLWLDSIFPESVHWKSLCRILGHLFWFSIRGLSGKDRWNYTGGKQRGESSSHQGKQERPAAAANTSSQGYCRLLGNFHLRTEVQLLSTFKPFNL